MKLYYDDVNTISVEDYKGEVLIINGSVKEVIDGKIHTDILDLNMRNRAEVNGCWVDIQNRFIVKTDYFDQNYTDKEVRLGSYIEENTTVFKLWAPTAYKVNLLIKGETFEMTLGDKGVFSYSTNEDLSGVSYLYEVYRDGDVFITCDPYAKASLPNRKASVVTNLHFDKVEVKAKGDVILEMHVRDFSMDPAVAFKNRGKFLGLLESFGHYGYSHVKDLGVGIIQLQPVSDFETVDELNPWDKYNWGYDPMQFFCLEGSYSSNIQDPQQVLRDFSKVVNQYHKDGLKITMDVVFNHIYEVEGSSLHSVLPYYFFRYNGDRLSNGTFCGNEIASEFTMVRKLIKEACIYFVEQFDVDGFRFDLMGITDIQTMNEIYASLKEIKEDIFLYGEGWNMECGLPESKRATMKNHALLEGYAFFNDVFRDTISGPLDGSNLGILSNGDYKKIQDVLEGTMSIFQAPHQSINYVECHDNYALADKLARMNLGVDEAKVYISATLLAKGHPFLQIGQSFYRNKKGVENSYQSSDTINRIEWYYLDLYRDLNEFTKNLIRLRKERDYSEVVWDGMHINIK